MSLKVKTIDSYKDFLAMKDAWIDLYSRANQQSPFASYEWIQSSLSQSDCKPLIITILTGSKLIAALPLKIKTQRLLKIFDRKYITHACDRYTDYSEILIDSDHNKKEIMKMLVDAIGNHLKSVSFLKIDNITDKGQLNRLFLKILRDKQIYKSTFANVYNPTLTLSDLSYISPKRIKDIERRERKLIKDHDVKFCIDQQVKPGSETWQKLIEFHSQNFPREGFNQPENQRFYRALVENGFDWRKTDFSYMTIDSEIAACHFGFKTEEEVLYYVPAYADLFREHSVGILLLYKMISHYSKLGLKEFNFLRGSEPYKLDWMSDNYANHTVVAVSGSSYLDRFLLNIYLANKAKLFQRASI